MNPIGKWDSFPRHWKMSAFGSGLFHENFIHFYPLYHISLLFGMAPSRGLPLSTPAPKWAAQTLNFCTQHCVPVSQLHVPHQVSYSKCPSAVHEV